MFIAAIALIGDESSKIKAYLEQMYKNKALTIPCDIEMYTAEDFQKRLGSKLYDLVILDIFLASGVDGLALAQQIIDHPDTEVIIMSGYEAHIPEYAISEKVRLISKPVTYDRLLKAISCWQQRIRQRYNTFEFSQDRVKNTILLQDILYIESREKALFLMCRNKIQHKFYGQLNIIEQQLEQFNFLRCHRSFVVNMQHIIGIDTENNRCGHFILTLSDKSTIQIPISARKMTKVLTTYQSKIVRCIEGTE